VEHFRLECDLENAGIHQGTRPVSTHARARMCVRVYACQLGVWQVSALAHAVQLFRAALYFD